MSYRDLRNFSEAMRALGFPTPISLESFRAPNWPLMAACTRWLCARIEPDAALQGGVDTLETRVQLVGNATALFHSRANIKLNGKRLYGADGWAVKELLKVANLLRAALDAPAPASTQLDAAPPSRSYDITSRLGEIKQARALATDITAQGAFLYDLLAKEPENKEKRLAALSRPLDMAAMEATLRRALAALGSRSAAQRERSEAAAAGAQAVEDKLQRRAQELQRAQKRLHTVQKIRPAYQGELTALENEIATLWDQYVLRYRCVEALKHQLSVLEGTQAEAAEEQQAAIMQLIHKYEAEDVLGKLSESDDNDTSDEDTKDQSEMKARPATATRPATRLRIKTAAGMEPRHTFGSMAGVRGMAGARGDSLDDIRAEDDSRSDSDLSDSHAGGGGGGGSGVSRWSRPRPRPATRTLHVADDDDDDLNDLDDGADGEVGDSLGSSSESELRLTSAGRPSAAQGTGRPSAVQGTGTALSDSEF